MNFLSVLKLMKNIFEKKTKRQLLKFLLQNLRLDGKNIVYNVQKPFNLIVESSERFEWCARLDSNQ